MAISSTPCDFDCDELPMDRKPSACPTEDTTADTDSLYSSSDDSSASAWTSSPIGKASTEPALPLTFAACDGDDSGRHMERDDVASQPGSDGDVVRRRYEERKRAKASGRAKRVANIRSAIAVSDPSGEAARGRFVVPESFHFEAWVQCASRGLEGRIQSTEAGAAMSLKRRGVTRRATHCGCLPAAAPSVAVAPIEQWKRSLDFEQPGGEDTMPRRTVWR